MFTDTIQYHKKVTKTITYLITIKEISVFHIRLSVGPLVLMSKLDCFTPPPPQNKRSKSICDTRVYLLDCNVWCLAGLEYGAMTLASLWNVTSCVFVQNVLRNGSVFRPLNLILNARYHWGECFQSPCISVTKFRRNRYLYFQGKYSNL